MARGIHIIRHLSPGEHPLFPSVFVRQMKGELSEVETRLLNILLEQMARGETAKEARRSVVE